MAGTVTGARLTGRRTSQSGPLRARWPLALLSTFLIAGCTFPCRVASRTQPAIALARLAISGEVVQFLRAVQREFGREVALCLLGERRGELVLVDGFSPTWLRESTPRSVEWTVCTHPRYIGIFHNHPRLDGRGDGCGFSSRDDLGFHDEPRAVVYVISCGDGEFVYRLRGVDRVFKFSTAGGSRSKDAHA